jgi:hypothetical protein
MQWTTPDFLVILNSKLEEYLSSKRDARATVVDAAAKEIEGICLQDNIQLPLNLHNVCSLLL